MNSEETILQAGKNLGFHLKCGTYDEPAAKLCKEALRLQREFLFKRIVSFFEKNTNDFEDFCDCELEDGIHQALCKTTLIKATIENKEWCGE